MFTNQELSILKQASAILESKAKDSVIFDSPELVKNLCINKLSHKESEVFAVLMLNSQHQLIEFVELFNGTINSCSVFPREVLKEVIKFNAVSVIFAHNHPSGVCSPSEADKRMTKRLVNTLDLIDVRVLDHIIVGGNNSVSLAEMGYL